VTGRVTGKLHDPLRWCMDTERRRASRPWTRRPRSSPTATMSESSASRPQPKLYQLPAHFWVRVWGTLSENTPMTHSIDTLPPSSAKSPESLWADGDGGRGSAVDNTYLDVGGAQSADQFKKDAVRLDQMSNAEKVRVQTNPFHPSPPLPLPPPQMEPWRLPLPIPAHVGVC
jgi:hypothetical protein